VVVEGRTVVRVNNEFLGLEVVRALLDNKGVKPLDTEGPAFILTINNKKKPGCSDS